MNLSSLSLLFATVALAVSIPAQAAFTSASSEPPPPPPPPPPGSSQFNAVVPNSFSSSSLPTRFTGEFTAPKTDLWFSTFSRINMWLEPGGMNGVEVQLNGGSFQSITAPEGYGAMSLRVGGVLVDADFNSGEVFSFASGVNSFQIVIASPLTLPANSYAASSFQMKLGILGAPSTMSWASVVAAPVPETSTFALSLLGVLGMGLLIGSRQRKAG